MNINKISAYKAIHILYWPSVFLPLQTTTIILSKIYRSCFFVLSQKAKLSIYQSNLVPPFTCVHEPRAIPKRTRTQIQEKKWLFSAGLLSACPP